MNKFLNSDEELCARILYYTASSKKTSGVKQSEIKEILSLLFNKKTIQIATDFVCGNSNYGMEKFQKTKELFSCLTDEERMEIISDYCRYCGDSNLPCYCENDE